MAAKGRERGSGMCGVCAKEGQKARPMGACLDVQCPVIYFGGRTVRPAQTERKEWKKGGSIPFSLGSRPGQWKLDLKKGGTRMSCSRRLPLDYLTIIYYVCLGNIKFQLHEDECSI
jgi:hypothetical protein